MRLSARDIAAMPSRRRAALVNSLSGYKSANLVGTCDPAGRANLSIVSSVVHLGSHPPLMAMIIRPGGEERHTLANLLATGQYSVNHVNEAIIEQAHQTAARYPRAVSEFEATGLSAEQWPSFKAPLVREANIKLALQLREHRELGINGTHLVIGEIIAADIPDIAMQADGAVQLHLGGTVALAGLDSYYRPALVKRMAYAKPDLPPRTLASHDGPAPQDPRELAGAVLATQVQCVLSTVDAGLPSQHLMAYAFDDSLQNVYLVSKRGTEKVDNMLANPGVSLLWDNRTGNTQDHCSGAAVMASGHASPAQGWVRARARFLLQARNPELHSLLARADATVFSVAINAYRVVRGYDCVTTFRPADAGTTPTASPAQAGQTPSRAQRPPSTPAAVA